MSNRSTRRVLAGLTLAAALTLGSAHPVAAEPAGAAPVLDVWAAVHEWLVSLWGGEAAGSEGVKPGATSGAEVVCGGDQGACIDPNG